MRLAQVQGLTANGKGFWSHVLPERSTVAIAGKRMLVVCQGQPDYWIHEDGTTELAKFWPVTSEDNGN